MDTEHLQRTEFYDAKSLSPLEHHLCQWIAVLKSYTKKTGDSPFRYRERTQVGFFAAASWLLGVPAREEWATIKGTEELPSQGRCDLWIQTEDYHIEAKHNWCSVSRKQSAEQKRIERTIRESKDSTLRLFPTLKNRLSFTFLTPCIAKEELSMIATHTDNWLGLVDRKIPCDAIAWYLPERRRTETFDFDYMAIGTVLLIHVPK